MRRSTSGSGARSSKKPHAFEPLLDEIAESPQRGLSMARMFDETPSLRARHIGRQLTWHDRLTPEIARRLQVTDDPYEARPRALVAAVDVWTAADGAVALPTILDRAMSAPTE
jgi:hypothetical protein